MSRIERLTERAITLAIAEANEELAVARLAFLAQDDHPALDAAISACLARRDRTLYTRWRAIGFLARARYEDQPTRGHPVPATSGPQQRDQESGSGSSRSPKRDDQPS